MPNGTATRKKIRKKYAKRADARKHCKVLPTVDLYKYLQVSCFFKPPGRALDL